ncbi:DUF1295 domain-containing protein [Plesiocystis pacifica]|uniref:DUF1295 domain-containing protein n=1 Tax=Plesiocystis pacifica TaxID=191768 RepID=UPI0005D47AF1|nr:DUF1295 domain-containing protein [Plesiocystis pacifica]
MGVSSSPPLSRRASFYRVTLAYVVALVVAAASVVVCGRLGWESAYVQIGVADLAATFVVFAFSYAHDNSSFYDAYWSIIPMWIIVYLAALGWGGEANQVRMILALVGVCYWGVRLTWNWARGWSGIDHEDWRYVDIRATVGERLEWLASLGAIHLFPTVMVFLGCLPLFVVCLGAPDGAAAVQPLGPLDALATVVTFGAVTIELVADNQLRDYVLHRKKPGETMTEGLWSWSRHPNYFGEMSFWWGLYLFGLAAVGLEHAASLWWMAGGALAMTGLFQFISIPMIEKRMLVRRKDYAEVQARVARFVPRPPRKRA